jgi:hypothetical protein
VTGTKLQWDEVFSRIFWFQRSFVVVQCVMSDAGVASVAGVPVAQACGDLLELLAGASDGRSSQGLDHPAAVVLALVAAATVAGLAGYTAMAGWVADVPQATLTDLLSAGGRVACGPAVTLDVVAGLYGCRRAASEYREYRDRDVDGGPPCGQDPAAGRQDTAGRVSQSLPADLLRLDGKTVRGAVDADGNQVQLLTAWRRALNPARRRC